MGDLSDQSRGAVGAGHGCGAEASAAAGGKRHRLRGQHVLLNTGLDHLGALILRRLLLRLVLIMLLLEMRLVRQLQHLVDRV